MNTNKEHLPFDTKHLFWQCPVCLSINAWDPDDAERFIERTNEKCEVSHGSCFDNVCGSCGANIVEPDSPILAPCYTHSED